jgi:cell division protein FtsI (penicillin-binding protein 3)
MATGGRSGGRRRRTTASAGAAGASRTATRGHTLDGRIRLLRIGFVVVFILICGRAIALASTESNLARIALRQQVREVALPAHRGSVLDRDGKELAVGQERRTVYATPYMLDDPEEAARQIADILKLKRRDARRLTELLGNKDSGFAYVARKVEVEQADAIVALDLPGVGSYAEEKRVYPMKTLAAQLVGFAGTDNKGLAGVEQAYDRQLSGHAGTQTVVRDPAGHALKTISSVQPVSGSDVRLTIDQGIQFTAERVLADTVRKFGAKGGTAIVMDPKTGEIYAMANAPLVDANKFGESPKLQRNRAVTDIYEPGSTFKVVTVAAALSEGLVTPRTSYVLPYELEVGGYPVHESHPRGTERFTVRRILEYSSNVGAVWLGWKVLGEERMAKWIERFGFGHKVGIDYPGEVGGLVLPLEQWSDSTIGNVPMGQGIAVTPLQMASVYAAVANDGVLVTPHLTAQVGTDVVGQGRTRRIISAAVARQLRSMLSDVVSDGTGTKAQIPGYTVAGKTGTAQKALPNGGGYSRSAYVASFVGMVPADDPQLVVLVMVDEPCEIWGGTVAAPAFSQIARFALQRLQIEP